MFWSIRKLSLVFLVLGLVLFVGCSQEPDLNAPRSQTTFFSTKAIPAGYYDSVDASTAAALRTSLHDAIDDNTKIPYTSSATDTWDVLEVADEDPNDSGRILDVYLNESYPKYGAGNTDYNREHAWAKSYGFPNDGAGNYPYTDCHHLFLCNDSYNSSRNNKPFSTVGGGGTTEKPTVANDGVGGGSGTYPGWSNWYDATYWETWWDRRGDIARALFYMDVRYEGGTHGVTGYSEPDLILTDNLTLITASNTGSNESVAYMGLLADLVQWHFDDPVDAKEMAHNDAVYSYQGNRNPFIDHPEWVDCLFLDNCNGGGDTTPPSSPTGLAATPGTGTVSLDWNDNGESDLAGYTLYRGTNSGGPYSAVNGSLLAVSQFTDSGLTGGVTYWYVVTASDGSGNESVSGNEVGATPTGGGGGPAVWINEFHYDNDSTDSGEFFEIAGTAGTSLAGWSVLGYNGNGGVVYDTKNLSGTLPDQAGGFGTLAFAMAGMQNGSPDGLALVDDGGAVVMFISYEGSFAAVGGPADGLTSTDIGVSEPTTSPVGWSLQLAGSGSVYGDFTWQAPAVNTSGAVNSGQSFVGAPTNQAPTAEAGGPYSGEAGVEVSFSSAGSSDPDGTVTGWDWNFGDGGSSGSENPTHVYAAPGHYTVTLTVTDNLGATGVDTAPCDIVDTTAPAVPTALAAVAGDGSVALDWADNGESDLGGYTVYRATTGGGPYAALNGSLLAGSSYTDGSVTNGTTYYYVVTASDLSANESGFGNEAAATPAGQSGGGDATVWINEIHYDNDGTDTGEFFEIAGTAGTDLAGWSVVAYNGSGGAAYDTGNLTGTLPWLQGGFGTLSFAMAGLQNGSPDGLALVDGTGTVVMFLSYEGAFVATDGPAVGLTSIDIGVSEPTTSPVGWSLQLSGTGSVYGDFTWQPAGAGTAGDVNTGQTLGDGSAPPTGGWQTITFDDFESGWGSFTDGGGDCSRYTSGTYAHQGSAALDIQDNSGGASSFFHTAGHDVSGFSNLEVEFWFYAVSMDKVEDFWVQYFDGSTWQTVAVFTVSQDFVNGNFYNEVVSIPAGTYNYPANAKLRFMCDASGNADDVYLDEIEFRGYGGN